MSEYYTLGSWNSSGVPNYLMAPDTVDQTLLNSIFKLLPETSSVLSNHPEYFTSNIQKNLIIQTSDPNFTGADIYVSFLHEGAGYKNVLGYFIFDLNGGYKIPTKWDDSLNQWIPMQYGDRDLLDGNGKSSIKKTIIFPNTSLPGSGGNLTIGSKVKILFDPSNPSQKFPNNIGVGFFIIPNGWSNGVKNTYDRIYTYETFNTQGSVQTIILNNNIDTNSNSNMGSIILAFEDIMLPAGDKDYNDVIFKITFSPNFAFNTENIVKLSNECYPGFTKILCKNIKTGVEDYIQVKNVKKNEHLVFSTITNNFIPVLLNTITSIQNSFVLIKKDSISENVPNEDLYITKNHPVVIGNTEEYAKNVKNSSRILLTNQPVYSICTENRDCILINNMPVVTWKYNDWIQKKTKLITQKKLNAKNL